jgi:hypothetical protein
MVWNKAAAELIGLKAATKHGLAVELPPTLSRNVLPHSLIVDDN